MRLVLSIIDNLRQKVHPKKYYSDPLPDLRSFQGRSQEIGQINDWLAAGDVQIIGVRGEGGIGKSTLTAKAFADRAGFQHKCWLDVRTGKPLAIAARQALKEFGIPPEQVDRIEEKDLPDRLLRLLQIEKCLLAIDNLESVLTKTGEWLPGTSYGDFLADFCQLGGESVVLLASREYPPRYSGWRGFKKLSLNEGLKPDEGAALLTALEAEGNQQDLEMFSRLVHGNPLALSLIAGWLLVNYDPGERLITQVPQEKLLQLAGRHRREDGITVEIVLLWSFQRLNDSQQQLLKRVSVLQDEFTAELAAALMADCDLEAPIDDKALRDLERRSLLQELPKANPGELNLFRMQPRLREWVETQASDNEIETAHRFAVEYFWARRTTNFAPDDSLEAARPHLATFYHQTQLKNYTAAWKILDSCQNFLYLRGYFSVYIELYQQSLAIEREIGDRKGESNSLANLGIVYYSLGQYQTAIEFHQQSLDIAREIGDRNGESNSLNNLGSVYYSLGQYQTAIEFHQQSLDIAREIGDRNGESNSLGNLGIVYCSLGQYQTAIEFHQQSLAIFREIGDRNGESNSLMGLGNVYYSLGQYQTAIEFHQQSLDIAREIGDRKGESNSLNNLGIVYYSLGQYQTAIEFHQQSLDIAREIGDRKGESNSLMGLGNVYYYLGQYQTAIEFHQQSLDIAREIGDRNGESNSLMGLGIVYYSLGQYQTAIEFHQQSLDIAREIGDRKGESNSLGNLGSVYYYLGQYQTAIEFHQQSLAIFREIGDRNGEAKTLFNQAIALKNIRNYEQARICYQQAQSLYTELGLERDVAQCHTALANCHPPALSFKLSRRQKLIMGFAIGLVVALVIWWLKK